MKTKLPTGISALIALLLVAFGVLYGTWSGFRDDRSDVTALLNSENGLMDVLTYRAADGLNLCVVARRHLSAQDEALAALETSARKLLQSSDLSVRSRADADMKAAVTAVSEKLSQTASFQLSERDVRYLAMLTADLNNLGSSAAVSTYNDAAQDFNQQLSAPLFGALARLLGVEACPVYE